jgi:hypothetical protein
MGKGKAFLSRMFSIRGFRLLTRSVLEKEEAAN